MPPAPVLKVVVLAAIIEMRARHVPASLKFTIVNKVPLPVVDHTGDLAAVLVAIDALELRGSDPEAVLDAVRIATVFAEERVVAARGRAAPKRNRERIRERVEIQIGLIGGREVLHARIRAGRAVGTAKAAIADPVGSAHIGGVVVAAAGAVPHAVLLPSSKV